MNIESTLLKVNSLAKRGKVSEAKKLLNKYLQKFPNNSRAKSSMAQLSGMRDRSVDVNDPPASSLSQIAQLLRQGDPGVALKLAKALVYKYPQSCRSWSILGAAQYGNDLLVEAEKSLRRAISLNPDWLPAYNNLGLALVKQGKTEDAVVWLNKAISKKPDYLDAHISLGRVSLDLEHFDGALQHIHRAIAINPQSDKALSCAGEALEGLGRIDEAILSYRSAIEFNPKNDGAFSKLFSALDRSNRLDELENQFALAIKQFSGSHAWLMAWQARISYRTGNLEKASKIFGEIDFRKLTPGMRIASYEIMGKCNDKLGQFDIAFDCFKSMNESVTNSDIFLKHSRHDYVTFNRKRNDWKSSPNRDAHQNEERNLIGDEDIAFLVGFPRSGTTLLDTILRSHPNIEVVEERPMLNVAQQSIAGSERGPLGLAKIYSLSEREVNDARSAYFKELRKHTSSNSKQNLVIDKLPLNILRLPFICKVFPEAKIIFASRHPLDSILSCWMQNFKLNKAMACMVDLGRIVDLYCVAMETLVESEKRFGAKLYQIKYENVLTNFEGELISLLKFLDLAWDPNLKNYAQTAKKRGVIRTPSYSQVVQPLYNDAVYRWRNYAKHLQEYFPKIDPWARHLGYEL